MLNDARVELHVYNHLLSTEEKRSKIILRGLEPTNELNRVDNIPGGLNEHRRI